MEPLEEEEFVAELSLGVREKDEVFLFILKKKKQT